MAAVPRRKLSQHHPRKQRTRAGQSRLAIAHGVGPGRAETPVKHSARCNRSQTHRGNPATNVSVPNISTSVNPAWYVLAKTSQAVHQRRRGLIKTASDSYRRPHLSVLFDFAGEDAGLISGRNPPGILGRNKMFTTHSEAWRGLEALCQPVHFVNKHHLFGGCSTSYTPIPVHLFFRPASPCSSFANATVSALLAGPADGQDGEHGGHPLPSLRSSHPDD